MNQMVLVAIFTIIYFYIFKSHNFTDEVFHIDEVTIYENKYSDNKYALAGDTLDAVSSLIFCLFEYILLMKSIISMVKMQMLVNNFICIFLII